MSRQVIKAGAFREPPQETLRYSSNPIVLGPWDGNISSMVTIGTCNAQGFSYFSIRVLPFVQTVGTGFGLGMASLVRMEILATGRRVLVSQRIMSLPTDVWEVNFVGAADTITAYGAGLSSDASRTVQELMQASLSILGVP